MNGRWIERLVVSLILFSTASVAQGQPVDAAPTRDTTSWQGDPGVPGASLASAPVEPVKPAPPLPPQATQPQGLLGIPVEQGLSEQTPLPAGAGVWMDPSASLLAPVADLLEFTLASVVEVVRLALGVAVPLAGPALEAMRLTRASGRPLTGRNVLETAAFGPRPPEVRRDRKKR